MQNSRIATLTLLNGPPGVGKSTIRRLRDDRPLSLLVDFDELWLQIGGWQHHEIAQDLAVTAGLAMARAHLQAGYDVIAAQLAVDQEFFEAIDTLVGEASAAFDQIVLIGDLERVAARFRQRRAARTFAGESDTSSNISDERIDEVIAKATEELLAIAAVQPRTTVISADGDVESTYLRACEALGETC
jgi:hypothetical protein